MKQQEILALKRLCVQQIIAQKRFAQDILKTVPAIEQETVMLGPIARNKRYVLLQFKSAKVVPINMNAFSGLDVTKEFVLSMELYPLARHFKLTIRKPDHMMTCNYYAQLTMLDKLLILLCRYVHMARWLILQIMEENLL